MGEPDDILRPLPCSEDAEKAVLSCCLRFPEDIITEAVELMTPEFFYVPANRIIYETIVDLFLSNRLGAMDLVLLNQTLIDRGLMENVGGPAKTAALLDDVPSTKLFRYYRDILKDKFILRKIVQECSDYAGTAFESEDAEDLLSGIESIGETIRNAVERGTDLISCRELASEALFRVQELYHAQRDSGGVLVGLPSGLATLDMITQGFQPGRVYVFAARPKMGKTALLRQLIFEAAQSVPVLFHSLEMSREDIVMTYLGQLEQVSLNKLSTGSIDQMEFDKITEAAHRLRDLPIWIDDRMLTAAQIVGSARKWKRRENIGMVAIDYVQLVLADGRYERENAVVRIQNASAQFVQLAKDLNVPVIVLAQLNREAEGKIADDIHMGYLKGAGALEQDAAFIGLLGNAKETSEDPTVQNKALKTMGRFSQQTTIPLTFYPHYTLFEEGSE